MQNNNAKIEFSKFIKKESIINEMFLILIYLENINTFLKKFITKKLLNILEKQSFKMLLYINSRIVKVYDKQYFIYSK